MGGKCPRLVLTTPTYKPRNPFQDRTQKWSAGCVIAQGGRFDKHGAHYPKQPGKTTWIKTPTARFPSTVFLAASWMDAVTGVVTPRMIATDVVQPREIRDPAPPQGGCGGDIEAYEKLCDSYVQTKLDADIIAIARAIQAGDTNPIVKHAAAVLDCVGAKLGTLVPRDYRPVVCAVMQDAARRLRSTRTMTVMDTGFETEQSVRDTENIAGEAEVELCSYIERVVENSAFRVVYNSRTKCGSASLKHIAWLDTASSRTSSTFSGNSANESDVTTSATFT